MKNVSKGWVFLVVALFLICSCAHTKPMGSGAPGKAGQKQQEEKTQKTLTAEDELKQGDQYLARGEAAAAIVHYQNALKKDPSLARAHLQMAKAYGKQRGMDQYEKELQEALKVDPQLAEARYLLASWYFTSGRTKEALAETETLLKANPENEQYRLFRVMIFDATKEYQKAIADLEFLAKAYPQKAQYLLSLGGMYRKIGNLKKSRQYLNQVKVAAPDSYEAKMAEEMLKEEKEKKK
jgi:Tfp pilus assembly protein PilF